MNTDEPAKRSLAESAVEKQIREAMERGEFDHLPGAGKPLDLSENPHTPDEWRLAFKLLKDNGVAPAWIEQGKMIRQELATLATWLERQARWQRERRAQAKWLAPNQMIAEHEHLAKTLEQACRVYRQRAQALNQAIDTYNLQVPDVQLQVPRLRIDDELYKFIEACQ